MSAGRQMSCGRPRAAGRPLAVPLACFLLLSLTCAGAGRSQTGGTAAPDPDRDARQRSLFQQAVARQQDAAKAADRTAALEEAVRLYRDYLAGNPASGAALNNLGRALEDLGRFDAAAASYRKAIELNDSRRLFYMENLARALGSAGDRKGANRVSWDLVKEQPLAEAPHALLMKDYLADNLEELPGYLWWILAAGQPERACLGALQALAKFGARVEDRRGVELLTIAALGLSRMTYDPASFGGTEAGRTLRELSALPAWGGCAREILGLHEGNLNPEQYDCWRTKREPKFQGGMTPTEGFRTLARSIGKRHRERAEAATDPPQATLRQSAFERAAGYFRFALDLNRHDDVDPLAFTELVRLEVSRDNFAAIEGIARSYEQSLFESKGLAYAQNRTETIFQFHKSLGELYAVLGVWGDSSDAKSAIFQLEHARKASDDLERKYAKPVPGGAALLPEEYRFSPEMTELLARSYEGVGQGAKVLPLRLEQAERYERAGDRAAARKVLAPVRAVTPPQELKPRFEKVLRAVDTATEPKGPAVVAPPAGAIERATPPVRVRELRKPVTPY